MILVKNANKKKRRRAYDKLLIIWGCVASTVLLLNQNTQPSETIYMQYIVSVMQLLASWKYNLIVISKMS